jgi:hypothetical protein
MDSFTLSGFDGLDRYTDLGADTSVDDNVLSALCSSLNSEEEAEAGASFSEGGYSPDSSVSGEVMHMCTATLPKEIHGAAITLPERMLRALAMLKYASSGFGAILAQFWMPVRGERQVLQPLTNRSCWIMPHTMHRHSAHTGTTRSVQGKK